MNWIGAKSPIEQEIDLLREVVLTPLTPPLLRGGKLPKNRHFPPLIRGG